MELHSAPPPAESQAGGAAACRGTHALLEREPVESIGNSSKTILIVLEESVAEDGTLGGQRRLPDESKEKGFLL